MTNRWLLKAVVALIDAVLFIYICYALYLAFFYIHSKGNTALHEAVSLGPPGAKVVEALLT